MDLKSASLALILVLNIYIQVPLKHFQLDVYFQTEHMQEKYLWFPRKPGLHVLFPISVSAVTVARAHMCAHTHGHTHTWT